MGKTNSCTAKRKYKRVAVHSMAIKNMKHYLSVKVKMFCTWHEAMDVLPEGKKQVPMIVGD